MRNQVILAFMLLILTQSKAQFIDDNQINVGVALPFISIMDIEPNNSAISLELQASNEAGNFIKSAELLNAKWLNISSAVRLNERKNIYVQIEYGSVPSGTTLKMQASNANGGSGVLGSSNGKITLGSAPQILINNVGGAFTGNGVGQGYALSYFLEVTNVADLDFNSSSTLGIIFTFIDN
jgi:hypothetical protein